MFAVLQSPVQNKALVDIRLPPVRCCPLVGQFEYTPRCQIRDAPPCVYTFSRIFLTVMCKHDVIHKPEVHKVSYRRQRRTEPLLQVPCTKWCRLKFSSGDMLADKQTNTQTNKHTKILRSNTILTNCREILAQAKQ